MWCTSKRKGGRTSSDDLLSKPSWAASKATAQKGVLVTTSSFTADATQYVGMIDKKVILIDGSRLAQLMIEHGVGVTVEQTYLVKRLDLDYYDDQEL